MQRKELKRKSEISKTLGKTNSVAIVVAEFNYDITEKLLEGALKVLSEHGFAEKNIKVVWVPGSFEIPLMCQHLARTKKFKGMLAIGAVIKGDTDHFYYISGEVSRGLMDVMLQESIPVGFGVITTNNLKQAQDRCTPKNNKGGEAAEAVLKLMEKLSD